MSHSDERRNQRTSKRRAERAVSEERRAWDQQQRKRRRKLSQNFLKDEQIAKKIVREAGVADTDLVVELGAGAGMLTRALSEKARKVVAVEYDSLWVAHLKRIFSADENVEVTAGDALSVNLPKEPFRVVANIPFHLSMPILHRLLDDSTQPPELAHLMVQKELARKHARVSPTTLKTLRWSPWYRLEAGFEIPAREFVPSPEVDACLLIAAKRSPPLVAHAHRERFQALVRETFNGHGNTVDKALRPVFTKKQIRRLAHDNEFCADSLPSKLTVGQWASVFEFMVRSVPQSRWPMPEPTTKRSSGQAGRR